MRRSRLRLGLEVVSDFADDNRFTLSALHTLSWLNSWGAELRTLGRIGSQRLLLTQLWQPLAPGSDGYIAPSVQYKASSVDVYQQGRRSLRLGYSVTATVAMGREFSNWGQVQVGADRRIGRSEPPIPSDGSADARFRETASYLQVQIDTLDSLALPSRGTLLQSRFEKASAEAGAPSRSTSSVIGLQAFRIADWAGHFYAEWSKASGGLAPLFLAAGATRGGGSTIYLFVGPFW